MWGECDKTCGGGWQTRGRLILQKPKNGGEACGLTLDKRQCNENECPPEDVNAACSSRIVRAAPAPAARSRC